MLTVLTRIAPALLIAACLAVVLVFILLAQYAHPSSDDFCMASGVNNHGLFAYLWQHYLEWSGRYSANALYAVYPLVFDLFDGYRYIPAVVIASLFAAVAYLLSTLFAVRFLSAPVLLAAAVFPLRHDISRSITGSLSIGLKLLWIWISSPLLVLASLLTPLVLSRLVRSPGWQLHGVRFRPTAVLVVALAMCTLALPIVLQFPAWWSMGGWPPPRTVDAIYFLFLLSWFMTVGAITFRFLPDNSTEPSAQPGSWSAVSMLLLTVLFSIAVVENRVFESARADLFNHARPYDEYMQARYRLIVQAMASRRHDLVVADYQREYPRTIYFNDIMHDVDHWRNACYADYFGLETIRRSNEKRNSTR
jgi:hypothetical protein